MSRRLAAPAALLAALAACQPHGETASVEVGAFAIELRTPGSGPWRGSWGDELVPGMKAIAVSPDLVERGLVRGTRVRIEGLPPSYRVRHELGAGTHERVEVFMGTDAEAARRWHERRATIWWETP
jgi:hypothetical protein